MFYGLPSADSDFCEGMPPDMAAHRSAFEAAITTAANSPGFPAAKFVCDAIVRMARDRHAHHVAVDVESKLLDNWGEHPSSDPLSNPAMAARINQYRDHKAVASAGRGRLSFGDQTLHLVFPHVGLALLAAPDAVRKAMVGRSCNFTVAKAVAELGPAGGALVEPLLRRLDAVRDDRWFDAARELAALGRNNAVVVGELLRRVEAGRERVRAGAAETLEWMETGLAGRNDEVFDTLERVLSDDGTPPLVKWQARRAWASVGRDREPVLAYVLDLAKPRPPRIERQTYPGGSYEYDAAMYERSAGIDLLKYFTQFPDRVVPVLIEAIDSFKEYDPDLSYRGDHERVCNVLELFGPAAAPAVPRLARHLEEWSNRTEPSSDYPSAILGFLAKLGPAAADALPGLERWRASNPSEEVESYDPGDPLDRAILAIRS